MKSKFYFLIAIIIIAFSCDTDSYKNKQIVLEGFILSNQDSSIIIKSSLPSSIYADLIKNNFIKDPFICCEKDSIKWVEKNNWTYKFSFKIGVEDLKYNNIILNLKSIDTYSEVFINNIFIERTNNSFLEYEIDIKNHLKIGENSLKIVLSQHAIEELKKEWEYGMKLPGGNRVFSRKAQFQYGWDWALDLNDRGIYDKINIDFFNVARIENLNIRSLQVNQMYAILEFNTEIHSSQSQNFELEINDKRYNLNANKSKNIYKTEIKIDNPKLWWPHNYGEQNLYEFKIKLLSKGKVLDQKTIEYGIRDVELNQDKLDKGSKFSFYINGLEVYMKGANLIPTHHFLAEANDSSYIQLVRNAKAANMNMLRVWGGGYYLPEAFYKACDKEGITIWQDFMFAGGMYPIKIIDTNEFIQQIKRINNHSSVVLWCGNNEVAEGWNNWGWQKTYSAAERDTIWKEYQYVFKNIIPNLVQKYSSNTPYWESSPKYGRGNPEYIYSGNAHNWWVWHDDSLFENYERQIPRFMTEFGFQSIPIYKTIKDNKSIRPKHINENLNYRQKHTFGFERIHSAMQRNLPKPKSLQDSIYLSQVLQAIAVEKGIRAQRTDKHCKGSLFWQLNDCWPAISWSAIDFYGNWKALMYRAKSSFDDLVIRSSINKDTITVFIGNELNHYQNAKLRLKIIQFDGKEIYSDSCKINIKPNQQGKVRDFIISGIEIDWSTHYVKLLIEAGNDKFEHIDFDNKLKNLKLEKDALDYEVKKDEIVLKANSLCLFISIINNDKKLNDNFFHIEAGEEKSIKIKDLDVTIKMLNDYFTIKY